MKYDFTSIMNRHGKDAIAVDSVGQMNGFAPEAPSTRPLAILVRPMNIMIPSSAGTRPATV